MKYAWIEDKQVRDICPGNPSEYYTPEVAALYNTEVDDDIKNGATFVGNKWANPAQIYIEPVVFEETRNWTAYNFRTGMTLAEKTKWDNDSAPEIVTVKAELPQELAGATELLDFLVSTSVIASTTKDNILK